MNFDLYKEILNIAFAISYIGKDREVTLLYKQTGEYMVSNGIDEYYPPYQKKLNCFDYKSSMNIPRDKLEKFAKYAAIDLIDAIYVDYLRDQQQGDFKVH